MLLLLKTKLYLSLIRTVYISWGAFNTGYTSTKLHRRPRYNPKPMFILWNWFDLWKGRQPSWTLIFQWLSNCCGLNPWNPAKAMGGANCHETFLTPTWGWNTSRTFSPIKVGSINRLLRPRWWLLLMRTYSLQQCNEHDHTQYHRMNVTSLTFSSPTFSLLGFNTTDIT